MTERGLLLAALLVLVACAVAAPAQAAPVCVRMVCVSVDTACVSLTCMTPQGTCSQVACASVYLPGPAPNCTPVQFTGRGPADVDVDTSCLGIETTFGLQGPELP
jgi:hypothetical protein